jgi:hypothetical protein
MRVSKSERGKIIKPDVPPAQKNRERGGICIAREQNGAAQSRGRTANGLQRQAFCFSGFLARLMQETDRSVS